MDKQLAQQLSELKAQMAVISAAIERIDSKVHEPDPEPQVPLWVKLAGDDSVPLEKVFAATQIWDAHDFDAWCVTWNKTKTQRVHMLREALETWQAEIARRPVPSLKATVNSLSEAEQLVRTIHDYKLFQAKLLDHARDYSRATLDDLCEQHTPTDFRTYYNWINQFLNHVRELQPEPEPEIRLDLYTQCVAVLNHLLSQIDTDIIPPCMFACTETFELKQASADAQAKHKKRTLTKYKEDLRRAFEYIQHSGM